MLNLAEIRKKFHQYPETCWTEFWTTAEICKYLESFGYELMIGKEIIREDLRKGVPDEEIIEKWYQNATELGVDLKYLEKMKGGLTGVIGVLDTGNPGPTIAFRADIDALPIKESKRKTHRPTREGWLSKYEGKMHACGHDVHLTIGLGIAEYIADNKDSLKGKFIMIFSPAEEGGQACLGISELSLINEIQYIFAYHDSTFPLGGHHVILPRIFFRSIDGFKVNFSSGKGPGLDVSQFVDTIQEGKNKSPIDIVSDIVVAMSSVADAGNNSLLAACTAIMNLKAIPRKPNGYSKISIYDLSTPVDELGFGSLEPITFNVMIRGANDEIGSYMKAKALHIVESAAKMYDVKVKIELEWNDMKYPAWNENSPELIQLAIESWKEIGMGNNVIKHPFGELGTDDVIYIMKKVIKNGGKAIYIGLVSDDNSGRMKNIHTNRFDFKDDLLAIGVNLITRMIEKIINN